MWGGWRSAFDATPSSVAPAALAPAGRGGEPELAQHGKQRRGAAFDPKTRPIGLALSTGLNGRLGLPRTIAHCSAIARRWPLDTEAICRRLGTVAGRAASHVWACYM